MDMFIKNRPIFDEMFQALLSLKNYHLSAYENCQDDINGLKLNLKDESTTCCNSQNLMIFH